MDPDSLEPGAWLRRFSADADSLLARLDNLEASAETKRLVAEACTKAKEAQVNYDIDKN